MQLPEYCITVWRLQNKKGKKRHKIKNVKNVFYIYVPNIKNAAALTLVTFDASAHLYRQVWTH